MGEREDPVRLVFTGAAGPGVVVGMVDMGTHLRLVANEIDAIDPPGDLPKLPTARALWVPRPDFTTSAESWLLAGGPHHTAYSQAVGLEVIEDFAEMVDVELLSIDADTTARQFRKEVRWSAAYRHPRRRRVAPLTAQTPPTGTSPAPCSTSDRSERRLPAPRRRRVAPLAAQSAAYRLLAGAV